MRKTIHSPHGKIIAQALVTIRKEAGLTQRSLASRLRREHSFVANYELGERRVDLAEFYWICKACDASAVVVATRIMEAFSALEDAE